MKHSLLPFLAVFVMLALWAGCNSDPAISVFAFRADLPSHYIRIDRMGMPGAAMSMIPANKRSAYNQGSPAGDAAGDWIETRTFSFAAVHILLDGDLERRGLTPRKLENNFPPAAFLKAPDVISIDTTTPSGFPNGRLVTDPVMDLTLAVFLLDLSTHGITTFADLPLNPAANDVSFLDAMPYLAPPHTK